MSRGVTLLSTELESKRLKRSKEASQALSCCSFSDAAKSAWENYPHVLEPAGHGLKLHLERVEIMQSAEFEDALAAMRRNGVDGVLVVSDPMFQSYQSGSAEFAARQQLPSISEVPRYAEAGGPIQYGLSRLRRRNPQWVNPADLPIERPTKFEFLINLNQLSNVFDPPPGDADASGQGHKVIYRYPQGDQTK